MKMHWQALHRRVLLMGSMPVDPGPRLCRANVASVQVGLDLVATLHLCELGRGAIRPLIHVLEDVLARLHGVRDSKDDPDAEVRSVTVIVIQLVCVALEGVGTEPVLVAGIPEQRKAALDAGDLGIEKVELRNFYGPPGSGSRGPVLCISCP